jgi:hypothetical protein
LFNYPPLASFAIHQKLLHSPEFLFHFQTICVTSTASTLHNLNEKKGIYGVVKFIASKNKCIRETDPVMKASVTLAHFTKIQTENKRLNKSDTKDREIYFDRRERRT